jgi:hypothetical protein
MVTVFPWMKDRMVLAFCPVSLPLSTMIDSWPFSIFVIKDMIVQKKIKPQTETQFNIENFVENL